MSNGPIVQLLVHYYIWPTTHALTSCLPSIRQHASRPILSNHIILQLNAFVGISMPPKTKGSIFFCIFDLLYPFVTSWLAKNKPVSWTGSRTIQRHFKFQAILVAIFVINAFSQAPVREDVYISVPPGFRIDGVNHKDRNKYCLKLKMSLYGSRTSLRNWFLTKRDSLF